MQVARLLELVHVQHPDLVVLRPPEQHGGGTGAGRPSGQPNRHSREGGGAAGGAEQLPGPSRPPRDPQIARVRQAGGACAGGGGRGADGEGGHDQGGRARTSHDFHSQYRVKGTPTFTGEQRDAADQRPRGAPPAGI